MNFAQLAVYAYTAIRMEMSVATLEQLARDFGSDTPVSGNALTRAKADLAKARS